MLNYTGENQVRIFIMENIFRGIQCVAIIPGRLLPDRGLPRGQGEDSELASALGEAENAGQADDGGARQVSYLIYLFCGR